MSRAEYISRLGNESNIFIDSNNNVGFGSTRPKSKLDVSGTVTGSSFVGSGTSITGINVGSKSAAFSIIFS